MAVVGVDMVPLDVGNRYCSSLWASRTRVDDEGLKTKSEQPKSPPRADLTVRVS